MFGSNASFFRVHYDRMFRAFGRKLTRSSPLLLKEECLLSPEWLILCVNNLCNLHCRMCDVGLGEKESMFWANLIGKNPKNMSKELMELILEQAATFFPRPRISLTYTEPLIHPDFLSFTEKIIAHGFYAAVTTNGLFLPRVADVLVNLGLHEITLSIDGPPGVHDRIRRHPKSFARLREGIEQLNAAKQRLKTCYPNLQISFTVSDLNSKSIVDFLESVKGLNPDKVFISHLNFITDRMAKEHNALYKGDLQVSPSNIALIDPESMNIRTLHEEFRRVRRWMFKNKPRFSVHVSPRLRTEEELIRYYHHPNTFIDKRRCLSPWTMMMIRTDGSIVPAQGRCFDYVVGSVLDSSLKEVWNAAPFRHFRRTLLEGGGTLPACARCCGVMGKGSEMS